MNAKHSWSKEQESIFSFFKSGTGHLVVEALAGTGKTTTVKEAFQHAPEARILYAVFNKRNQKEAEEKITDHRVEVKTLHSLGFAFIKRVWSGVKPDDNVEADRAAQVLASKPILAQDKEFVGVLLKLVGFVKNICIGATLAEVKSIAEAQGLLFDNPAMNDHLFTSTLACLEKSKVKDSQGRISFNDMVWLPCAMKMVRPWFDLVCIDEAQDMNLPQLMMALQACKAGGRVVVVGDSRQAIYGFRGAVQDGMNMMKVTLRAKVLSLTTTYRCPKKVVELAAQLVPAYTAAPTAPEGKVESINEAKLLEVVKPGDAILSRLNAPLMPLALAFLRKNVPARIEGRDIGRQLVGMVRSLKAKSVPDFIARIDAWLKKQVERLGKSKNAEKKIEQAKDIAQTLDAIAQVAFSITDIEARITSLFQDTDEKSKPAVVLSSVHKAKGLEWNRVYLLSSTFRHAKGGEEANIYYVALTRAKSELYLVGAGSSLSSVEKPAIAQLEAKPSTPSVSPTSVIPPRKAKAIPSSRIDYEIDNLDIPCGQVRRQVGDVIQYGPYEYAIIRVGPGSATAKCLSRSKKIINNSRTGESKEVEFDSSSTMRICNTCEASDIIRRFTSDEVKNFIEGKARPSMGLTNKNTGEKENNSMKKTTKVAAVKVDRSRAGSAEMVRDLVAAGVPKNEIKAKLIAKYPIFGIMEALWEKRYNTAVRLAKSAKEKASEPVKAAKAPVKAAKAGKSTPPPRPAPEAAAVPPIPACPS